MHKKKKEFCKKKVLNVNCTIIYKFMKFQYKTLATQNSNINDNRDESNDVITVATVK